MSPGGLGDLRAAAERIRRAAVEADPALAVLPLSGIGWATVEGERAEHELDPSGSWTELERDPALGARRWLRAAVAPDAGGDPALVILEPDTEGRIAASLARFGEGVAVAYLGDGAIVEGRLVRGGPAWGPHVVAPAAEPGIAEGA